MRFAWLFVLVVVSRLSIAEHATAFLPLAAAALGQVQSQGNGDAENKSWVRTRLSTVYKGGGNFLTAEDQLLLDAGLLSEDEITALHESLKKKFPTIADQIERPESRIPKELAERVMAAMKKLQEKNLLLVARGQTCKFDAKRRYEIGKLTALNSGCRAGVMSKVEYETIYGVDGKDAGSDGVGYPWTYNFRGRDHEVGADYRAVLDYVGFGCDYDEATKTWVNRYRPNSPQLTIINETQRAIREIYAHDVLFDDADDIRQNVLDNFETIRDRAANQDPAAVVRRQITLFNMRRFFNSYRDEPKIKEILGSEPTDSQLLRFYDLNGQKLKMVHGLYSPRLNVEVPNNQPANTRDKSRL